MDTLGVDIGQLVGSYGFPIAVTWFLLTKGTGMIGQMNKTFAEMTTAIVELKVTVTSLSERLDRIDKEGK